MLSSICRQQKNLNGSNSYRANRNFLDGSRIYREAIETNSRKFRWIENVIRSVEKSNPWVSINSYLSRSVEKLLRWAKIVFQRREKHKNECNQACYPTKDPNNILNFQNHLSTRKNVKHLDPKHTHTYTKQV